MVIYIYIYIYIYKLTIKYDYRASISNKPLSFLNAKQFLKFWEGGKDIQRPNHKLVTQANEKATQKQKQKQKLQDLKAVTKRILITLTSQRDFNMRNFKMTTIFIDIWRDRQSRK